MEQGLRTGTVFLLLVVAGALASCKREAPAPPSQVQMPSVPRIAHQAHQPEAVSAAPLPDPGQEASAGPAGVLPVATVASPVRARAQVRRALARGDLFEDEASAIPLLLALQQLHPGNAQDAQALEEARLALQAQAWVALANGTQLATLADAQRHDAVMRALWPDQAEVRRFGLALERAVRAFGFNDAGFAALRLGKLEGLGGAMESFRQAQLVWPAMPRTQSGFLAVEAAWVARALTSAKTGDFGAAQAMAVEAGRVRGDAKVRRAALQLIETLRIDRMRRLGDEGLMALGSVSGLQVARERLAEILRIARPGERDGLLLRERIDQVSHYGLFRPGQVFTDMMPDGSRGPSMRVLTRGSFQMGAAEGEPGATADEQPQHPVGFERGFAMGRHEITVAQFRRFVDATGHVPRATQRGHSTAYDIRSGNFLRGSNIDWQTGYDGRPAAPDMPVIHVSARDAEAYVAWLSDVTKARYRLPSEAEFEYALRAGGQGRYPWGDAAPPVQVGNLAGGGDSSPQGRRWSNAFPGYTDGWWGPAPVGSFLPNAFGLHDLVGNVSEWVADCWHKGYRRAPSTGVAWVNPGCRTHIIRGASWASAPAQVRSAWRMSGGVDVTNARVGFRVVRQL